MKFVFPVGFLNQSASAFVDRRFGQPIDMASYASRVQPRYAESSDRRFDSAPVVSPSELDSPAPNEAATARPTPVAREESEVRHSVVAPFPNAREVYLVGSFTAWEERPMAMIRQADGTWSTEVLLEPGRYEYKFLVDGAWFDDPSSARVPNGHGSMNNVLQIYSLGNSTMATAEAGR